VTRHKNLSRPRQDPIDRGIIGAPMMK